MTDYVDICDLDDIPNGRHRAFDVAGRSILIFRVSLDVHAVENRCSHLDFPLAGGRQIGFDIICRKHGARFDIRTGAATAGPAVDPLRRFDARVRAGRVELAIDLPAAGCLFRTGPG